MNKVKLTHAAKMDLQEIKDYISITLRNPAAANGILKGITTQIRSLESFPQMGTVIELDESSIAYRYLVYGNYMSFYHIQNDSVIVDRILYGRRNYLKLLLGSQLDEDIEAQ